MEKQPETRNTDLNPYLQELTSEFNKAISNGENFGRVKKIYIKIKLLENHLKALQKEMGSFSNPWLIH